MPDTPLPGSGAPGESAASQNSLAASIDPLLRRLRTSVISNPRHHVARMDRLTTAPMLTPAGIVDLHLLRAEARQQLGEFVEAVNAWKAANEAAQRLQDPARTVAVAGVRASLAAWLKQKATLEICDSYLTAITAAGPAAHPRTVYGQALKAIVVSLQDCTAALAMLDALLPSPQDPITPVTTMLHSAAVAIRERCRNPQQPPRTEKVAPPPLPGGLWQPDLARPDPDCLAWYSRTYAITHTCPPATAGPTPAEQEQP